MEFSVFSLSMLVLFVIFTRQMGVCNTDRNLISWEDLSIEKYLGKSGSNDTDQGRVIVVSKDGTGDSKTVQGAVDLVPLWSKERVKIIILPGVYRSVTGWRKETVDSISSFFWDKIDFMT